MKTYKSFGALQRALESNVEALRLTLAVAMEKSALAVEATAKAEFGHYQETTGGWEGWAELKDSTKSDRVRQGYTENDPLLRSGKLRESVTHTSGEQTFVVASADPVMLYQELGTSTIPPRPVLAPALYRNIPTILNIIGKTVEETVAGQMRG